MSTGSTGDAAGGARLASPIELTPGRHNDLMIANDLPMTSNAVESWVIAVRDGVVPRRLTAYLHMTGTSDGQLTWSRAHSDIAIPIATKNGFATGFLDLPVNCVAKNEKLRLDVKNTAGVSTRNATVVIVSFW